MNSSPCLSDYKERFDKFANRRINVLKRRLSLHRRLYKRDNDNAHVEIINQCVKSIYMLETSPN